MGASDRKCEPTLSPSGSTEMTSSSTFQCGPEIELNFPNATHEANNENYLRYFSYMKQVEAMPVEVIKSVLVTSYSIGVFANILLLMYIVKSKRYRSPTFAVMFALAITDLGTCASANLFAMLAMYKLLGPPWLCEFCVYFTVVFYLTSIAHMVFFSMMRFYQLVYPLKARARVTVSLVVKVSVVLWVVTAIVTGGVPTFFSWSSFTANGQTTYFCTWAPSMFHVLLETMYLLIPNILIAGFHMAKYCVVKKQSEKSVSEGDDDQQRQSTNARAVTIVIVIFCVTSWPHLVHVYVHDAFNVPLESFHTMLSTVCIATQYGNSALNPFIYALCAGSIRRDILKMLGCNIQVKT